jgi:hypothetical protein
VTKGREELLSHRTVMTELLRVLAFVVPGRDAQPASLSSLVRFGNGLPLCVTTELQLRQRSFVSSPSRPGLGA